MFFASFQNILVISPHPDDSEYSCYGMIKKLNADTKILICSSGGQGDLTNSSDRVSEVKNFWKADQLSIDHLFKDLLNSQYCDSVKYLDELILRCNFDAIFIPPEEDTNQEHRLISSIAKSSLRNKPSAVFEYWTPSTTHNWQPNVWLDIDPFFSAKIKLLLSSFQSQQHKSYFQPSYIELFHQDWQAFKKGIHRCEKYRLISWMCK